MMSVPKQAVFTARRIKNDFSYTFKVDGQPPVHRDWHLDKEEAARLEDIDGRLREFVHSGKDYRIGTELYRQRFQLAMPRKMIDNIEAWLREQPAAYPAGLTIETNVPTFHFDRMVVNEHLLLLQVPVRYRDLRQRPPKPNQTLTSARRSPHVLIICCPGRPFATGAIAPYCRALRGQEIPVADLSIPDQATHAAVMDNLQHAAQSEIYIVGHRLDRVGRDGHQERGGLRLQDNRFLKPKHVRHVACAGANVVLNICDSWDFASAFLHAGAASVIWANEEVNEECAGLFGRYLNSVDSERADMTPGEWFHKVLRNCFQDHPNSSVPFVYSYIETIFDPIPHAEMANVFEGAPEPTVFRLYPPGAFDARADIQHDFASREHSQPVQTVAVGQNNALCHVALERHVSLRQEDCPRTKVREPREQTLQYAVPSEERRQTNPLSPDDKNPLPPGRTEDEAPCTLEKTDESLSVSESKRPLRLRDLVKQIWFLICCWLESFSEAHSEPSHAGAERGYDEQV